MKYITKILFLLALGCLCLACEDKQEEITPQLSITTNDGEALDGASLSFESEGGTAIVKICSNSAWSIGCSAEWISLSMTKGSGDSEVTISADATEVSRSAVVVVYVDSAQQIRCSFNVVQHEPAPMPDDTTDENPADNPENQPEDNPDEQPDDTPDDTPDNTPDEQPDDTPDDTPSDQPEEDTEDNPSDQPEDDTTDQPEDNPTDQPDDNPDDTDDGVEPEETIVTYKKITDIGEVQAGTYYIGGYQKEVLHLAVVGISTGHLHTAPFTYDETSCTLTSADDTQAVELRLEVADGEDAYYLHFVDEGYLMATKNSAGALTFTDEPQATWQFKQGDGGLELCQIGDIYVKLIISRRATDRLLRSIDGDEDDGNPIVLFCKEKQ